MLGLSGFTVVRKLNQEPPKQPFISMLRPRAHELARMSEEKGRRRRRIRGGEEEEEDPKQPPRDV
jgi:hypothetical protein